MNIDLIIGSNRVFTGQGGSVHPATIVAAEGRIVFVGERDEARAFVADHAEGAVPEERFFDDALIVPGFHDSHLHFFHSAIYSSPLATTFLGESEADCVQRIERFAETRPREGWLLAQGWREYRWNPPITPTKRSLDAAFPDRPVALYSGDAHTLWLNSTAMRQLGLTRESEPPAGGSYDRDNSGNLTGIVREAAAMELMPKIMGAFTDDEVADAYRGFLRRLAENGVTSVCDMSLMAAPGLDFIRDDVHAALLAAGDLTCRINLFPTLTDDTSRYKSMRDRYRGDVLRAGGFKQFFDGVSSQHTAWVTEPYSNARFKGDCGRPTVDPAVMRRYVMGAARIGAPVRIHAIGDAAIHAALDIFAEARERFGALPDGRHNCLEHLENFLPGDISRLAQLDVVAAVQPPHMTLDPGGPERDLGPRRVELMWPFKTMLEAGATLAFGTDSPVVDVNSMGVLYSAVARKDPRSRLPEGGWLPAQCISPAEAIAAYTLGSAQAAGQAGKLGTIETGKLADLAVLDHDITTCDPEDILRTGVLATVMGGRVVYEQ